MRVDTAQPPPDLPPPRHEPERQRWVVEVDGRTAVLDYVLDGSTLRIVHTGVPPEIGGRGIAAVLVGAALTLARRNGWKVLPQCSYAAAFIARHRHYQELLA